MDAQHWPNMPATVSESGSARKARGRVAEAPRKATGHGSFWRLIESMPHPHIHSIRSFLFRDGCEGGIAFFRGRLAEGTRNTPHTPRKAAEGSAEGL